MLLLEFSNFIFIIFLRAILSMICDDVINFLSYLSLVKQPCTVVMWLLLRTVHIIMNAFYLCGTEYIVCDIKNYCMRVAPIFTDTQVRSELVLEGILTIDLQIMHLLLYQLSYQPYFLAYNSCMWCTYLRSIGI